jgi:hypothetical protein
MRWPRSLVRAVASGELDGTTLEVADMEANRLYFSRAGASRGQSAFPQMRAVGLVESGIHSIFGSASRTLAPGRS